MLPVNEAPLATDLLFGAANIADYLGMNKRTAYYQIANGQIPTVRMGRLLVASKTALRRHVVGEVQPVGEVKQAS